MRVSEASMYRLAQAESIRILLSNFSLIPSGDDLAWDDEELAKMAIVGAFDYPARQPPRQMSVGLSKNGARPIIRCAFLASK